MEGYQGDVWRTAQLLLIAQQSLSRIGITHFVTSGYSYRAFRANGPLPQPEEKPDLNGLMPVFSLLPVFTDVDLSLLDPTSYFGRCLCSGLFYAWNKTGRPKRPVGFKLIQATITG